MEPDPVAWKPSKLTQAVFKIVLFVFATCPYLQSQSTSPPADGGRPHLQHETDKVTEYNLPNDPPANDETVSSNGGPFVAPGLGLPKTGRIWALDTFQGKQELVHLKYTPVQLNKHTTSNILKIQAAPLFYKPKNTIEISGTTAIVRLHDPSAVFFVRSLLDAEEDASNPSSGAPDFNRLNLVRLEVKGDHRVAATIAFTQITENASRSAEVMETITEPLSSAPSWYKITSKLPLAAGEYALIALPKGQNLFGAVLYDFAIDAKAPENTDHISPSENKRP